MSSASSVAPSTARARDTSSWSSLTGRPCLASSATPFQHTSPHWSQLHYRGKKAFNSELTLSILLPEKISLIITFILGYYFWNWALVWFLHRTNVNWWGQLFWLVYAWPLIYSKRVRTDFLSRSFFFQGCQPALPTRLDCGCANCSSSPMDPPTATMTLAKDWSKSPGWHCTSITPRWPPTDLKPCSRGRVQFTNVPGCAKKKKKKKEKKNSKSAICSNSVVHDKKHWIKLKVIHEMKYEPLWMWWLPFNMLISPFLVGWIFCSQNEWYVITLYIRYLSTIEPIIFSFYTIYTESATQRKITWFEG